jgi:hypothetical protein
VDLLRQGKSAQIEHDLDLSAKDSNTLKTLAEMAANFSDEVPESTEVLAANIPCARWLHGLWTLFGVADMLNNLNAYED